MQVPPINVTVQSPPTSVWTVLLPSLIGIAGVLVGSAATFFINRNQAESRYRKEQQDILLAESYERLFWFRVSLRNRRFLGESDYRDSFWKHFDELLDYSFMVRIELFASPVLKREFKASREAATPVGVLFNKLDAAAGAAATAELIGLQRHEMERALPVLEKATEAVYAEASNDRAIGPLVRALRRVRRGAGSRTGP